MGATLLGWVRRRQAAGPHPSPLRGALRSKAEEAPLRVGPGIENAPTRGEGPSAAPRAHGPELLSGAPLWGRGALHGRGVRRRRTLCRSGLTGVVLSRRVPGTSVGCLQQGDEEAPCPEKRTAYEVVGAEPQPPHVRIPLKEPGLPHRAPDDLTPPRGLHPAWGCGYDCLGTSPCPIQPGRAGAD
jgi:hypothetical protein